MSADLILTTARQYLAIDPTIPITLLPIKKGASGRTIVRVRTPVHGDFIGIHWTDERADNRQFVPVARFLKSARLRVPEILHDASRYNVALVEDLGDVDLLSVRHEPFAERVPAYRSAFEQLDKLFYVRASKDLELMPPFDAELYRWEQQYFFDHFIGEFLGLDPEPLERHPAFNQLATRLGVAAKHLVHRDFQSQNLLLRDGKVFLIDFQGLRRGRQEYDLASLIYDPYLAHSAAEREELLALWEDLTDERPEPGLLHECAAQRLMQALGAYGKLVVGRGDKWYAQHIPQAVEFLREVLLGSPLEDVLEPYLEHAALRTQQALGSL